MSLATRLRTFWRDQCFAFARLVASDPDGVTAGWVRDDHRRAEERRTHQRALDPRPDVAMVSVRLTSPEQAWFDSASQALHQAAMIELRNVPGPTNTTRRRSRRRRRSRQPYPDIEQEDL